MIPEDFLGGFLSYNANDYKDGQRQFIEASLKRVMKRKATYIERQQRRGLPLDEERLGHYDRYIDMYENNLKKYHSDHITEPYSPDQEKVVQIEEEDLELMMLEDQIQALYHKQERLKKIRELKDTLRGLQSEIDEEL